MKENISKSGGSRRHKKIEPSLKMETKNWAANNEFQMKNSQAIKKLNKLANIIFVDHRF